MVSGQSPNPATQQDCPVYADFVTEPARISELKHRFQTVEQIVNAKDGKHDFGDWFQALKGSSSDRTHPK